MLCNSGGIVGRAALTALRHHVKQPGHGYPDSVDISELNDIDYIVQFCDIFDALVTKRSYKGISPPFQALHTAYAELVQKSEPRIAKMCADALQDDFIGSEVIMPCGSYGTLIDITDRAPVGNPVIKLRNSGVTIKGDGTPETEPVSIIGIA
jgi:HD-GYP domain-containing protein (c-di-GMP phosphodiesterase class II)